MITTANLGLIVWDSEEDDFEHSQLANNFVRIDEHSHLGSLSEELNDEDELPGSGHWVSLGLGLPIKTGSIEPGAIWRYLLKERAVGSKQIAVRGVKSENVAEYNILNEHLANESVDARTIENESIPIDKLDPNILTLGSVILWYKYSISATPGNLWHICDGTAWAEIPNALGLTEGFILDLRKRFVRGTDINHTGEIGGTSEINLSHSHNVTSASLEHTHIVGSHNHTIAIDGKHHHTFANGYQVGSRKNAFVTNLTIEGHHNALQSIYLEEFNEGEEAASAPMDQAGEHNHGGFTGLSSAFSTGGSSLSGSVITSAALTDVSVTPPFVGLVYIMRVL